MPKFLPQADFRARRRVLLRSDFAYAPKPAPAPNDIIDKGTWQNIVTLPDDVAVRTSNYHGTILRQLHDLWGAWVECCGTKQDSMFPVMLDAGDDFQAATYNAFTGFYRLSIAALRSAFGVVAIGTWAQVCGKDAELKRWRAGKEQLSFGKACDGLIAVTAALGVNLRSTINDSLFNHKSPRSEGGFARRIFDGLSEFSHSRPGYADGDIRNTQRPNLRALRIRARGMGTVRGNRLVLCLSPDCSAETGRRRASYRAIP